LIFRPVIFARNFVKVCCCILVVSPWKEGTRRGRIGPAGFLNEVSAENLPEIHPLRAQNISGSNPEKNCLHFLSLDSIL